MNITAIYGPNGSGKTQYIEKMRRQMASDSVRYVAFRDSYGVGTDQAYYLQLRWNQHDIDAETPTAAQLLEKAFLQTGADTPERRRWQQELYRLFGLSTSGDTRGLLDKYIITLSSGELRKFQLARTLLAQPQTLIIDNPFIGLDAETRDQLRTLLQQLASSHDLHIYIVVSRRKDIPDYVTDVVDLSPTNDTQEVISFHNVTIRYDERTILRDLNWTVRQGEHWALSGQNGAGKSTLLSLVCADNPQRYACDIRLFGHRQGDAGMSIWDIKRRIGYVSPEMHRSYHRDLPALHVVASGLKDTVGLYVRPTAEERQQCLWWMRLFGVDHLADRSFLKMSSGEQRLVLVARAFVKDPALLILDEPLHGLDDRGRRLVLSLIEAFCSRPEKTLVFVSHYREEWPSCIDHELYLKRQE
jgi:ABC-type molybdenum transport system, ATPase component/photorepair protein PhrA